MARSYWNGVVAIVAALVLGGGMSWLLFAQAPETPPDRFVTVDVSNEKVRCKILRSWPLPSGGRAYQVKSVEKGEMLTIVRESAGAGDKDAPVRVYKWSNPTTSPFGAPEPPASAAAPIPSKSAAPPTVVEDKSAITNAMPPVVLNDAKKMQSPYALSGPNAAANPKETIIVIPAGLDTEASGPVEIVVPPPLLPVDKRPTPAPRKDDGFDNSVDQLGQAPWIKDEVATKLPGQITLEPLPEKSDIRVVAAFEPEPKPDVQRDIKPEPPLPLAPEPKSEPMQPASAIPPPLPEMPATRPLPPLEEVKPVPPPPLPSIELPPPAAAIAPPPPIMLPAPEIPPPLPKNDGGEKSTNTARPQPVEHGPVMVPPYESAKTKTIDRLVGASASLPGAPPPVAMPAPPPPLAASVTPVPPLLPAAAVTATPLPTLPEVPLPKKVDAQSHPEEGSRTPVVIVPPVIPSPSPAKNVVHETVVDVIKEQPSFVEEAPIVSKITDFAATRAPAPKVVREPEPPAAPPQPIPVAAVKPGPIAVVKPAPPPSAATESDIIVVNPEAVVAVPTPIVKKMLTTIANRSVAMPMAEFTEMKSVPPPPRTGGYDRTRTAIAPGQVASAVPMMNVTPAPFGGTVEYLPTSADSTPIIAKRVNHAAPRSSSSIVGLIGGLREERPVAPRRTLAGNLFGGNATAAAGHVVAMNPSPNPGREIIVDVTDSRNMGFEPVVKKRSTASAPRPTTIVGLMGGHEGERIARAQSSSGFTPQYPVAGNFDRLGERIVMAQAAPGFTPQYPSAAHVDRTRVAIGPGPIAAAPPASPPKETIVVMADGKYVAANPAPVVEKRPTASLNRSTTIVGLMGVERPAASQIAQTQGAPFTAQRPAAGSFDRTRTTIDPDQLSAQRAAAKPNTSIGSNVVVSDAAPIVQKRNNAAFNRSTTIVGMMGANRTPGADAPYVEAARIDARRASTEPFDAFVTREAPNAPQANAFTPPPAPPPFTTGAFSAAPAARSVPPADRSAMAPSVAYAPPPIDVLQPPVNPIQQAAHNVPAGKFAVTVPANSAMDRPVTTVVAGDGDRAALAQLMRTAQESQQPSQRELAVMGLAKYDGRTRPQLVAFLNQLAVSDPAPAVRASAVNALARMNVAPDAIVNTLETLRNDADVRVRQAVSYAETAFGMGRR